MNYSKLFTTRIIYFEFLQPWEKGLLSDNVQQVLSFENKEKKTFYIFFHDREDYVDGILRWCQCVFLVPSLVDFGI